MFKIKNIVMALVFSCLILLAIPQISASSTEFDNTEFESQLTSEEKAEIEEQQKLEDYESYQEVIELREGYKNFQGIRFYQDQAAFDAALKETYNLMKEDKNYNEDQKNEYYNAVIGSDIKPGIMYQFYDFSNTLKAYNENENIVVDSSAAIEIINEYGSPNPKINNIEYLNLLNQALVDVRSSFVEVPVSTASTEEIREAMKSNVIFTKMLKSMYLEYQYYSKPNSSLLSRIGHSSVIMNIAMFAAVVVLFVVRFPIIKKQQEYAWNEFKPLSLLVIPVVTIFFYVFFTWFFTPTYTIDNPIYTIYLDGVQSSGSDRIYLNEVGSHEITLVAAGSDMTVGATSFNLTITDNPSATSQKAEIPNWSYGDTGLTTFANEGTANVVEQYVDDEYEYTTLTKVIKTSGILAKDVFEPDETTRDYYVSYYRDEFILPMSLRLVAPSLLFGTLFFMFILMPKPMVKMYLNELYTINKFCGFLSYNMAYRSNARVLIEETLQSLDACKFAEDFAIIFFEKDRNMTDKIQDISQIYSYKFFEMYLGIVNIIFDEGVSDSTLKSLSIIQQFGDEYYNQADMFFKSKSGAISSLLMIIAICVVIPVVVKVKAGLMFLTYLFTAGGYTATIGSYLIWFGLVCLIYNMFKDNKIVRAEGRYV